VVEDVVAFVATISSVRDSQPAIPITESHRATSPTELGPTAELLPIDFGGELGATNQPGIIDSIARTRFGSDLLDRNLALIGSRMHLDLGERSLIRTSKLLKPYQEYFSRACDGPGVRRANRGAKSSPQFREHGIGRQSRFP